MAHRIIGCALRVAKPRDIAVFYDGVIVGKYTADRLVEDQLIVKPWMVGGSERRAHPAMPDLTLGDRHAPILVNFGSPEVEIRRITVQIQPRETSP